MAGNHLLTARSGGCEGYDAEIGLLDPRTGDFRVLLASPSTSDADDGLDLRNIVTVDPSTTG